jgi:hypothetical protein
MKRTKNFTKDPDNAQWRINPMKVLILLGFLLIFTFKTGYSQKISPYLVGNNYWIPGTMINEFLKPGGLVDQADIQTIRIGGFGPNGWSDAQYLEYIRRIKAMGALPIVQVRASYSAQQAIDFIKLVNVTNNLGVRVWSIGNEPDHPSGGSQSDAQIADYTKRIAAALKSVDPTITVIAIEFSGYNAGRYANFIGGANSVTGLVPGKDYYYVDVIGFHKYVITDVSQLMGSINDLVGKVNAANASRPAGKKLMWGMGEFNSHYNNDLTGDPNMKVWSFNNGQFHAELWGVGMQKSAFSLDSWSMIEGPDRSGTDLSLFDKDYKGRSTYWHSLMFGQNMKQNYLPSNDNQTSVGVVAMGDETGVAVMIINKSGTAYAYNLRLDNGALGTSGLQISVNAGINVSNITGNIGATTTQMLVFCPDGSLKKQYTYSKANADARAGATIQIFKTDCDPVCGNNPPTINPVTNQAYEANSGVQNIALSGIGDGDGCTQGVSVTAVSSDPAIVAVSGVAYTSCNLTSTLSLNPLAKGVATITVTVTDGGAIDCPPAKKSISFDVTVNSIINVPGKIEAEDFTTQTGIQTQATTDVDGGLNIGYSEPGDHLEYTVKVNAAGTYSANFRVASLNNTGAIELRNGAGTKLTSLALNPGTGDWQTWVTKPGTTNFTLGAGVQTIQIYYTGAGLNINWFELASVTPVLTSIIVAPATVNVEEGSCTTFTAQGFDQFNNPFPTTFTWLVSGGGTINNGYFCATTVGGPYTVSAKSGTITGTAQFTVTYLPVLTSIVVTPPTASVQVLNTVAFSAQGLDQFSKPMSATFEWSVSGGGSINSSTGLFTAGNIAGGPHTVTAQSGLITGTAQVTISDVPPLGKIEAEAYTAMYGIQTQATTDAGGGLNIGWVDVNDWLDYAITVPAAGAYNVSFRVASQLATGAFQLKKGATVLASLAVPNTGGWQNWQTISAKVTLAQGAQTLRIQATGAGLNINWINFEVAKPSIKIEAESYSAMFGIQTETTTDAGGGLNVGYTDPGDWMDYTVNIPAADIYTVDFRVASLVTTGKIELRNQAGTALASLTQGSTGGWQTWVTKSVTATLPAGSQTLRIYYIGAGLNINWFELTQGLKSAEGLSAETNGFKVYPNPATNMITVETNSSDFNIFEVRSISGAVMLTQPISGSVTDVNIGDLNKGMYLVTLKGISTIYTQKLIVQ